MSIVFGVMKILWFSNCAIANSQCNGSGSWLFAMKDILSKQVELFNITDANVKNIEYRESKEVKEYLIPKVELSKNGIPSIRVINSIRQIVERISPDVIHIWGLEKCWAKLFAFGYIEGNVLLEIQGVLSACANMFWGGMTPEEVGKTHRLKELIKPSVKLEAQYADYVRKGLQEINLLNKFLHISTQSEWTRLQIKPYIKDGAIVYKTLRPIRREFYMAPKWQSPDHRAPVLFTSVGYNVPFKGMHVLLKALRLITDKYPQVKLVIAGFNPNVPFYKANGYDRLLMDFIEEHHLVSNVVFPGRLEASQIIEYLLNADVYVNPTFIESYSAATAEALFLGVPSVLAYSGALPNFKIEEDIALYYSPLDYVDCASKIILLLEDCNSCKEFSKLSSLLMTERCSRDAVLKTQLNIYNKFLAFNENN